MLKKIAFYFLGICLTLLCFKIAISLMPYCYHPTNTKNDGNFILAIFVFIIFAIVIPVLSAFYFWKTRRSLSVGIATAPLAIPALLSLFMLAISLLFRPSKASEPYLTDVMKNVSWLKNPLKIYYVNQHTLFSLDIISGTSKQIIAPVDDFRFSPSGERVCTSYFRTDGEDKTHPEILNFNNFPSNSYTVLNLKTEKVEYQESNDFACSNLLGFIDEKSLLIDCAYKFKIINSATKETEIIPVPARAEDPFLTTNNKVVWHHRDAPFICHEYGIETKEMNKYARSPDTYFCSKPDDVSLILNGAILWGNDWAWDHRMISVDGKRGIASCKDGEDTVLCLKSMNGGDKFLVRCKGCESFSKNTFGPNPYYFEKLDWSKDGRFVLFSFNGKIYLYDFKTNQTGYLADGEMSRFY
jgi:hypothetical protein